MEWLQWDPKLVDNAVAADRRKRVCCMLTAVVQEERPHDDRMRMSMLYACAMLVYHGSLDMVNERIPRDEGEGPIAVKDRRLGTDRRRSRQRTVVVSDVSYATVYLVRNALAGIERATCSTERLAVRTASCGSRRERFAARRVGEHVSSDVSLCTSYQS